MPMRSPDEQLSREHASTRAGRSYSALQRFVSSRHMLPIYAVQTAHRPFEDRMVGTGTVA